MDVRFPRDEELFTELFMLALTVWREASDQTAEAKVGVAWSIRNRALHPSWWGNGWLEVVTKLDQYSSMEWWKKVPGSRNILVDPNEIRWPKLTDTSWLAALQAAQDAYIGQGTDPTGGATHYFDKSLDQNPPSWATDGSMKHTVDIGAFHFYGRAA